MKKLLLMILALQMSICSFAQQLAIKSDVAWDAMMVPNLGVDVVVGNRTTLGLDAFGCNGIWGRDIEAYGVQPEYRYYFSGRAMHQHYIGVGALGLFYNENKDQHHYEGYTAGAGLLFGYVMHLGKRFNIDFHAGCGIMGYHQKKDLYDVEEDTWSSTTSKGFLPVPTSLGISVSYVIK